MACHTTRQQRELLRVVRSPAGEVSVDPTGRANGRGAYVCRDAGCIATATRRGDLARALTTPIPDHLAAELAAIAAAPRTGTTTLGGPLGQE